MPITPHSVEDVPRHDMRSLQELHKMANQVAADALHVYSLNGSVAVIEHSWDTGADDLARKSVGPRREETRLLQDLHNSVIAGSPKHFLLSSLFEGCHSFLLHATNNPQYLFIFGFTTPQPPKAALPDDYPEMLDLIAYAHWSSLEVARLRDEVTYLNQRLSARKIVERAKGLLQTEHGLSEEQAYEQLRRTSRQRRVTLAAVSEQILRSGDRRQGA